MSEPMQFFRRRRRLDPLAGAALARVLAEPTYELIPLRSALDHAAAIPVGATVSVTASPGRGLDATLDLAVTLEARGFRAVPHVAARMIRDRPHLRELLGRMDGAGIERAFVVGGDATEPGDYPDGLSLLREMAELGRGLREIGIPCYPQGHPFIPDDVLLEALAEKAPFASYMTTQLCFDAGAIASWLRARRADGVALPVKIGVPAVAEPQRLLMISARIGVRDTQRFLARNMRLVGRLLRSGGFYRPTALLEELAPLVADRSAGIKGFHLYTFNAVEPTEAWRVEYLASLQANLLPLDREALLRDLAIVPYRVAGAVRREVGAASGEWLPREIARHLIATESEVWQPRLRQLAAGDHPRWPWTEPGLAPAAEEEEVAETFAGLRRETIALLRGFDEATWRRSGTHETLGELDVAGLMREALIHDEEHLAAIGGSTGWDDQAAAATAG